MQDNNFFVALLFAITFTIVAGSITCYYYLFANSLPIKAISLLLLPAENTIYIYNLYIYSVFRGQKQNLNYIKLLKSLLLIIISLFLLVIYNS